MSKITLPLITEIDMSDISLADLGEPIPLSEHLLRVARPISLDPNPERYSPFDDPPEYHESFA